VTYKVLAAMYGHNLDSRSSFNEIRVLSDMFELDQDLDRWRGALDPALVFRPDALKIDSTVQAECTILKFQVILHLRDLNLQCMIYRPCLELTLRRLRDETGNSDTTSSLFRAQKDTAVACLDRSQMTIRLVHSLLCSEHKNASVLGAWWFTTYFGTLSPPFSIELRY
jgi:hypothetical protein